MRAPRGSPEASADQQPPQPDRRSQRISPAPSRTTPEQTPRDRECTHGCPRNRRNQYQRRLHMPVSDGVQEPMHRRHTPAAAHVPVDPVNALLHMIRSVGVSGISCAVNGSSTALPPSPRLCSQTPPSPAATAGRSPTVTQH